MSFTAGVVQATAPVEIRPATSTNMAAAAAVGQAVEVPNRDETKITFSATRARKIYFLEKEDLEGLTFDSNENGGPARYYRADDLEQIALKKYGADKLAEKRVKRAKRESNKKRKLEEEEESKHSTQHESRHQMRTYPAYTLGQPVGRHSPTLSSRLSSPSEWNGNQWQPPLPHPPLPTNGSYVGGGGGDANFMPIRRPVPHRPPAPVPPFYVPSGRAAKAASSPPPPPYHLPRAPPQVPPHLLHRHLPPPQQHQQYPIGAGGGGGGWTMVPRGVSPLSSAEVTLPPGNYRMMDGSCVQVSQGTTDNLTDYRIVVTTRAHPASMGGAALAEAALAAAAEAKYAQQRHARITPTPPPPPSRTPPRRRAIDIASPRHPEEPDLEAINRALGETNTEKLIEFGMSVALREDDKDGTDLLPQKEEEKHQDEGPCDGNSTVRLLLETELTPLKSIGGCFEGSDNKGGSENGVSAYWAVDLSSAMSKKEQCDAEADPPSSSAGTVVVFWKAKQKAVELPSRGPTGVYHTVAALARHMALERAKPHVIAVARRQQFNKDPQGTEKVRTDDDDDDETTNEERSDVSGVLRARLAEVHDREDSVFPPGFEGSDELQKQVLAQIRIGLKITDEKVKVRVQPFGALFESCSERDIVGLFKCTYMAPCGYDAEDDSCGNTLYGPAREVKVVKVPPANTKDGSATTQGCQYRLEYGPPQWLERRIN